MMVDNGNRGFDQLVHDAYDRMSPSEEAQQRMLANLLAAQEQTEEGNEGVSDHVTPKTESAGSQATAHVKPRVLDGRARTHGRIVRVVLPFAAVFLVGAVIAGALLGQQDTYTAQSVAQVEVSTSTAESSYEEAGSSQSMAENRTDEANAAMSGAQSPGSQTADSADADTAAIAREYPLVELSDGTKLTVDSEQSIENTETRGPFVEKALAWDSKHTSSVACKVYHDEDDPEGYIVRFQDSDIYYRALK